MRDGTIKSRSINYPNPAAPLTRSAMNKKAGITNLPYHARDITARDSRCGDGADSGGALGSLKSGMRWRSLTKQGGNWRNIKMSDKACFWFAIVVLIVSFLGGIPGIRTIYRWITTGIWQYGW